MAMASQIRVFLNQNFRFAIYICRPCSQVWQVWYLGLVTGAAETAVLMVLARVSACVWGENYWLMGNWTAERLRVPSFASDLAASIQFLKQVDNVDHFYKEHRQRSMLQECSEESQPQVIQVSFLQWPCWLAMSPLTC